MNDDEWAGRQARFARSRHYPKEWLLDLDMGPHPLWQLEDLLTGRELRPGSRVLDLGAGRGATAVFLAREYDVEVVAADLWTDPTQVQRTLAAAGVGHRVRAVQADARALPFAAGHFDAVISVDAFEYFGTDVHLLPRLVPVLKPGGLLAMSTPALRRDPYEHGIPAHVLEVVGGEAAAWHPPDWWRRHWELSGLLDDVQARWQDGGGQDWLTWARAGRDRRRVAEADAVVRMLERDTEEDLGFALVSATRRPG